ncbi:hypothetical protein HRG_011393 [Hirsutella rhossiliensis]|uniref:Uncharacterized protein n=1 Tax=Hirsutella rhossiliensis TaxID=111463 RepID=A0A9P8MP53_9HYPO|nr:uncharacterized protein HRG_11393 [Hirsutella rhossiliensis]KAH0957611.1 hypothetical protein HRG_11393 [Hirsutella rhossiliensis]
MTLGPQYQKGEVYITTLKESLDWTPWTRGIKSWAQTHHIWEYVNPEGTVVLEEPLRPSWEELLEKVGQRPHRGSFPNEENKYKAAREDFNEKLQDAKDLFRYKEKTFQDQLDRFKAREKAMMQIEEVIKKSISEGLQGETLIQLTPRDKIKELKQKVLPSAEEEKNLIDERYHQIINKKGTRDWKAWAEQLDQVILDSRDLAVSTINDTKIRQDFLKGTEEWDPSWPMTIRLLDALLERTGLPATPLRTLIADFKREVGFRKKGKPQKTPGVNNANNAPRSSDQRTRNGPEGSHKCPACKQHWVKKDEWWESCWTFRAMFQKDPPEGWIPRDHLKEAINQHLKENPLDKTKAMEWKPKAKDITVPQNNNNSSKQANTVSHVHSTNTVKTLSRTRQSMIQG